MRSVLSGVHSTIGPMTTATASEPLLARARAAHATALRADHERLTLVAELEAAGVATECGYRSTPRLLEDLFRIDPAPAKRLLAQSQLLAERTAFGGEPLAPVLPRTAAAFAEGEVGSEHVRVIASAMDAIGTAPDASPADLVDAEALLAEQARTLSPAGVEKLGRRIHAHLDPDGVAPVDPPAPEDELTIGTRQGALAMGVRVHDRADQEMVREVLDRLSGPAGPDDERPVGQRRAEALLDIIATAGGVGGIADPGPGDDGADGAADGAPDPGATPEPDAAAPGPARPLVTVTVNFEWLALQVGHGLLDTDRTVSITEARRLACDAGIVPVVLGSRGQPLDVGRLSYVVPDGMRRALNTRDRGCTFPGCSRRPRRCHAHHVIHWVDGGDTALETLTLLCRYHHHLIHHGDWQVRMQDGRPWFVPPRWIDPRQRPRPGGPHPVTAPC